MNLVNLVWNMECGAGQVTQHTIAACPPLCSFPQGSRITGVGIHHGGCGLRDIPRGPRWDCESRGGGTDEIGRPWHILFFLKTCSLPSFQVNDLSGCMQELRKAGFPECERDAIKRMAEIHRLKPVAEGDNNGSGDPIVTVLVIHRDPGRYDAFLRSSSVEIGETPWDTSGSSSGGSSDYYSSHSSRYRENAGNSNSHGISKKDLASPGLDLTYAVGRSMFETDRIREEWVPNCNDDRIREIWVPSEFNVHTFAGSGVLAEKLQAVPEPIDTDHFDPETAR